MSHFIHVCALLSIWVICLNLIIMYLCFLWINFSFLSNYLLWNLSYETDLLNDNVLWTISTYHYSIIGFIDLIINIILWTTSWMLLIYYFSFKVSIECVLVTIISVKLNYFINLIFIINKTYLNSNILIILLLVGLDLYLPN